MTDNASSNSLAAGLNPELWEPVMQLVRHKESVAIGVCNVRYGDFQPHDKWHKPYRSFPAAPQDYTRGTDVNIPASTATDESGDIDQIKIAPFYVDTMDKAGVLTPYDFGTEQAADCVRLLDNVVDQKLLAEYSNADNYVDDGSIGGTAGNYITMSSSNVDKYFLAAKRKLDDNDVAVGNRFAIIGSRTLENLLLYISGKDTSVGDEVGMNGYVGKRFGFQLFYSNNIPFTATLTMATNPTEADTVVIGGVTFTFNATISGAGSVLLDGSTVDTSRAALTAAVNDSGTVGTTYVQLSAKNRKRLIKKGIVATNSNSADTMTIVAYGDTPVSETLSNGSNIWSVQRSHELFGAMRSTELRFAISPKVEFRDAQLKLGKYVLPYDLYGVKTFQDGTEALVEGRINASAWTI